MVVRGCYRSLTLIIHGNTAEDLGQFNIDFDVDNSLASLLPSPSEGKLEDLPPALLSDKLAFEESILSPKCLSLPTSDLGLSSEMKQFLRLSLNICQISDDMDVIHKVARSVASVVCSHGLTCDYRCKVLSQDQCMPSCSTDGKMDSQDVSFVLAEASNELLQLYKSLQILPQNEQLKAADTIFVPEVDLVTSQLLVDVLFQCFPVFLKATSLETRVVSQV